VKMGVATRREEKKRRRKGAGGLVLRSGERRRMPSFSKGGRQRVERRSYRRRQEKSSAKKENRIGEHEETSRAISTYSMKAERRRRLREDICTPVQKKARDLYKAEARSIGLGGGVDLVEGGRTRISR